MRYAITLPHPTKPTIYVVPRNKRRASDAATYDVFEVDKHVRTIDEPAREALLASEWHDRGYSQASLVRPGDRLATYPARGFRYHADSEMFVREGYSILRCTSDAHSPEVGGRIDHCASCMPFWGWVARPTVVIQSRDALRSHLAIKYPAHSSEFGRELEEAFAQDSEAPEFGEDWTSFLQEAAHRCHERAGR